MERCEVWCGVRDLFDRRVLISVALVDDDPFEFAALGSLAFEDGLCDIGDAEVFASFIDVVSFFGQCELVFGFFGDEFQDGSFFDVHVRRL